MAAPEVLALNSLLIQVSNAAFCERIIHLKLHYGGPLKWMLSLAPSGALYIMMYHVHYDVPVQVKRINLFGFHSAQYHSATTVALCCNTINAMIQYHKCNASNSPNSYNTINALLQHHKCNASNSCDKLRMQKFHKNPDDVCSALRTH